MALLFGRAVHEFSVPAEVAAPTVDLSIYRHAIHVGWVVSDLDRVVPDWERLGLRNIRRARPYSQERTCRGKKTQVNRKMAWARIGDVDIEWMQPLTSECANAEFLRKHGDGIHHLAYAVPTREQFDQEINRFKSKGIEVAEEWGFDGAQGKGRAAYIDTAQEGGGLMIEMIYNPDSAPAAAFQDSENEYPFNKVIQYAFVVHNVKKVGAFYERLGFGRMPVDHNISVDRNYRGEPGKFEMYLGWWRWGDVTFEWIQPLAGPSVYDEYLKAHGDGFHHLAFNVKDMDQAIELFKAMGVAVAQSGGWRTPRSQGRFAYLDTGPYGGVTIELRWNRPRS